jgi:hypothetical protein
MARWEDDPQGDGRSDADRGACTSDGEQMNWLGDGSAGEGGWRHLPHLRIEMWGRRHSFYSMILLPVKCRVRRP